MDIAKIVLESTWKFPGFRGVQEKVVERLLVDNKSALCVMPTGGGKSLCYQVPAMCLEGITLVVSPLIALMKDQVDVLKGLGVPAASMDSSLSMQEMAQVKADLRSGALKILYVAPERLNNEMFVQLIAEYQISLLAVDEAHCISEWGPSFRPDYLKVARFCREVGAERVLALTATATPDVCKDICEGFEIDPKKGHFETGNFRSNLSIKIVPTTTYDSKLAVLIPFLKSRKGGAAIVYVTTQGNAELLHAKLVSMGMDAEFYHAGRTAQDRKTIQEKFMKGNGVVVATIAFGMGIDKANIRQVAHWQLPKTKEGYSQEIGRAGRDGLPSVCLMLPSPEDVPILESFARSSTPSLNALKDWLKVVFTRTPAPDGSINFNLLELSKTHDIANNTLGLLYAQLELRFELMRAVTPFYSSYQLKPAEQNLSGWQDILSDQSPEAKLITGGWSKGTTWCTLDLEDIANESGVDRAVLARQITLWEGNGLCETKVSGVRNRYMPYDKLPSEQKDIDEIAQALFDSMKDREDADVKRLYGVCEFVASSECFAHGLAKYFGDKKSVPKGKCGSCTYCETKKPLDFCHKSAGPLEESKINQVLSVCGVRDDSRFLARLAFGISSPRITALGLSRHPIFGSCPTADFTKLVERFEKECQKVDFKNKAELAPPAPPKAGGSFFGNRGGYGGSSRGGSSSARGGSSSARGGRGGWGAKMSSASTGTKRVWGSSGGGSSKRGKKW